MRARTERSAKPQQGQAITKFIKKVFFIFREVLRHISHLIQESLRLVIYFFKIITDQLTHPNAGIIASLCLFLLVSAIAATQWAQIGVWLGSFLGLKGLWGVGSGTCGLLLGLGINVFQLTPELYKIKRSWAIAYAKMGIEVDGLEHDSTPQSIDENWNSIKHSSLKKTRLVSFAVETALVLSYAVLGTGLEFFAIATAAISLILPELTLKLVSSMISVLGEVSSTMDDAEPEKDHVSFN
ncbi:hypothetical protein HUN01_28605 [Nostoc edaphicum CCNP1411]|uniref:Uncharacterized protein n=1 Tax=Nostoc edaphicum CCNP1411 TaxID=1472755 RepID=A0A7D7R867_9NOSO|nr:hypothetical protein [Nostoc edaphicum]QMS91366.1 hypothetical protein HUN01_28605 [Nostoc edaphicum CCNP1411]